MNWLATLGVMGCRVVGRVVGSVDSSQWGRLDGASRWRPQMWCDGSGLWMVSMCSLGCMQPVYVALQLEGEQMYVRAAAPERICTRLHGAWLRRKMSGRLLREFD
jgi:hypothetical protein